MKAQENHQGKRGHGEQQTRKLDLAISALLTTRTLEEAAEACGINERTLRRWIEEPEFRAALTAASRQVLESSVVELSVDAQMAVETLRRNLRCGRPEAEIRAAQIILAQAMRGIEFFEFERRLAHLEELYRAGAQK